MFTLVVTWPVNQRALAVTAYVVSRSITTTQRNDRRKFNIPAGGNTT